MDSSYTVLYDNNSAPVLSDTINNIVGSFPFYYNLPIVKDIMDKDINDGLDILIYHDSIILVNRGIVKDIDEVNWQKLKSSNG